MTTVEERVIKIVANQLGANPEQLSRDTHFFNDLGADSLDTVELVMELEEEFDIQIPDNLEEAIETVGQAVDYLQMAVQDVPENQPTVTEPS
jgi:acyl carrier protein